MRPARLLETTTAAATHLRRARLFHPRGRSFSGEVRVWGTPGPPTGLRLLDQPGEYAATVRISKGVPTPTGWPDVLGLAVRLHRAADDRPFDLLVSSSGATHLLRHLPLPHRSFAAPYTTIISYRLRGRRLYFAALPDPDGPDLGRTLAAVGAASRTGGARFVLAVARPLGSWRPFGQVSFGTQLDAREDAMLAFDPIGNLPAELRAVGMINRLRAVTYPVSRRVRGADLQSGGSAGTTVP